MPETHTLQEKFDRGVQEAIDLCDCGLHPIEMVETLRRKADELEKLCS